MKSSLARLDTAKMNVKKISQLIFTFTLIFGLFIAADNAFAWGGGEIPSSYSGTYLTIDCLTAFGSTGASTREGFYTYFNAGSTPPPTSVVGSVTGGQHDWDTYWCQTYFPDNWDVSGYIGGGGAGNYMLGWSIRNAGDDRSSVFYIIFGWDGSQITSVNLPYIPPVPHIDTFSYSTTTAQATITGYWEATTTPYITQRLSFWQYSDTLGKESYEQLTATTTGAFSFTFDFKDPYAWSSGESSTTPIYSSFTLNASLDQYDETNYVFPYGGTIIDNLDATSTTLYASSYNASDFISTPRDLALYPEYDCDLVHLSGCLKNAAIWLFYPTQDALDSWTTLKTTLETKAPFGYFYSVKNAVGGLSATSTPSFSLTIPAHLKTYFFDPFDTGIAGILWFFFIFHFYKRLKHIQI